MQGATKILSPRLMQELYSNRFHAAAKRKLLRERAVAYKGGRCRICGYSRCINAFDFHHPDPIIKDFTISAKMTAWKAIVRELNKCDLLCANCHREVHDGMHPAYLDELDDRFGQDEDE